MEELIRKLMSELTAEEKIALITGENFSTTRAVPRLGIPAIALSDGPHGVRAQESGAADHLGLGASAKATCFPTGAALASSWDRELLAQVGSAIAEEARAKGIAVLFGPAFNIKRSPLCGRSFEYYSEDPVLSGELAASYVKAVQEKGVAACPKHFACNNQESYRLVSNSIVDERTMREVYLPAFERVVKHARPWAIMNAYNKINGTYCSENSWLLKDVLREEWEFDGAVISDYGSVARREASAAAGVDLEMPGTLGYSDERVRKALEDGMLSVEELDTCVENLLRLILRTRQERCPEPINWEAHHQLARQAAARCMVLLKNEGGLLPLAKEGSLAVIGALAQTPRYQGGGSSHVASWAVDIPLEELAKTAPAVNLIFAPGYDLTDGMTVRENLIDEAVQAAKQADRVLLFVGLTEQFETEGQDRLDMDMPPAHLALIDAVTKANPHVAVVLTAGAPLELPWLDRVPAVLNTYTAGDGMGGALADLLFGDMCPSGKLAETFPEKLCHVPAQVCGFHGSETSIRYGEGVFVGYRYYDYAQRKPAFPFGHGLSYTVFAYEHLRLSAEELRERETLTVSVEVCNTGDRSGAEVIQLYVAPRTGREPRPIKELKDFTRLALEPGERKTAIFTLDWSVFASYSLNDHAWTVSSGEYDILVASTAEDIRLRQTVVVYGAASGQLREVTMDTTLDKLAADSRTLPVLKELMRDSPMYDPEDKNAPAFLSELPVRTANHMGGQPFTVEELDGEYIQRFNAAIGGQFE